MGYYINKVGDKDLPAVGKAAFLMQHANASFLTTKPVSERDFIPDLVCVVKNPGFDAAGYAFDAKEMMVFAEPTDQRRKIWLIVPNAAKLSGFSE